MHEKLEGGGMMDLEGRNDGSIEHETWRGRDDRSKKMEMDRESLKRQRQRERDDGL